MVDNDCRLAFLHTQKQGTHFLTTKTGLKYPDAIYKLKAAFTRTTMTFNK